MGKDLKAHRENVYLTKETEQETYYTIFKKTVKSDSFQVVFGTASRSVNP